MKIARAKAAWFGETGVRLDAAYHLSEGRNAQLAIESYGDYEPLSDASERIFLGNRFRRTYVNNSERGYPYITASDMTKTEPLSGSYLSKVHTGKVTNLMMHKGWILVSCSGSIGRTVYTNEDFEGQIGTHDLIRIIPKNKKIPSGYLFAFLASNAGFALMTQGTYGGVIQHIEPHHICNLPVPLLEQEQMQVIHEKIEQAAKLREAANAALKQGVELLENVLPAFKQAQQYVARSSSFAHQRLQFDATVQHTAYDRFLKQASQHATLKTVGSVPARVFTPDIFKRIRVADAKRGVVFLSGTDLLETRPKFDSFLSRKTPKLRDYILEEGWLALQDSGSLSSMGYVSIVPKFLEGTAATNNLIRIVPKADNYNPYLFAYFKTKQGQAILKSLSYGTGQIHIDNAQIEQLQVPVYEKLVGEVTRHITDYTRQFNQAYELETSAISLVESAVTSWQ